MGIICVPFSGKETEESSISKGQKNEVERHISLIHHPNHFGHSLYIAIPEVVAHVVTFVWDITLVVVSSCFRQSLSM